MTDDVRAALRDAVDVMVYNLTGGCRCAGCDRRRAVIRRCCIPTGDPVPDALNTGAEQERAAAVVGGEWDQPGIRGPVD